MIQPRPYQREAVDAIYRYFETKNGHPLIVIPTGGGKSVILAVFLREVLEQWPDQRILVITHVRELIEQNAKKLFDVWPHAPAGIYSAGLNQREASRPITFAGIQSIYRIADQLEAFDLVLIDEAHLVPPDGEGMYRQLLTTVQAANPKVKVIGLTATPFRLGQGMLTEGEDRLFTDIAFELPLRRLLDEGHLSPLTTEPVRERANLEAVRVKKGEFASGELEVAMQADNLVNRVVAETCKLAADRKGWLVFAAGVAHARALRDAFCEAGIGVCMVTGQTSDYERTSIINRFKKGEIQALVNVGVLTTGFDAPHTDCLVFVRPTLSPVLYLQMLGRGMRVADGKTDCLVLDYAGNIQRHGPADKVNPPRAKGAGGGEPPYRICDECGAKMHASAIYCGDCGKEFPRDHEKRLKNSASAAAVLSKEQAPFETVRVTRVVYARHEKPDSKPTLKVDYYGGISRIASEWICFEHIGYARTKAIAWWASRTTAGSTPTTVGEAIERKNELRQPDEIVVSFTEKWPRVLRARFEQPMQEAA